MNGFDVLLDKQLMCTVVDDSSAPVPLGCLCTVAGDLQTQHHTSSFDLRFFTTSIQCSFAQQCATHVPADLDQTSVASGHGKTALSIVGGASQHAPLPLQAAAFPETTVQYDYATTTDLLIQNLTMIVHRKVVRKQQGGKELVTDLDLAKAADKGEAPVEVKVSLKLRHRSGSRQERISVTVSFAITGKDQCSPGSQAAGYVASGVLHEQDFVGCLLEHLRLEPYMYVM